MRDSTSYADPGLQMGDTFALATVFDSEVGPSHFFYSEELLEYRVQGSFSQSNLKVSTDLG
jgi:hypothetical protein